MPIITLTTDSGSKDYYAGAVKGAILKRCENATIIDISHQIEPFNIIEAAFILKNAYPDFPEDTIHIISVNAFNEKDVRNLAIYHKNQYFIGADNGIYSLLFDDHPKRIIELENETTISAFPLRDIFAKAACRIAGGTPIEEIGNEVSSFQQRTILQPVVQDSFIRGTVIYVDSYENVITNIRLDLFENEQQGREFSVFFKRYDDLRKISDNYYDVPEGEMLCIFNASGLLEIAINKGKAGSLLGMNVGDTVQVDFRKDGVNMNPEIQDL